MKPSSLQCVTNISGSEIQPLHGNDPLSNISKWTPKQNPSLQIHPNSPSTWSRSLSRLLLSITWPSEKVNLERFTVGYDGYVELQWGLRSSLEPKQFLKLAFNDGNHLRTMGHQSSISGRSWQKLMELCIKSLQVPKANEIQWAHPTSTHMRPSKKAIHVLADLARLPQPDLMTTPHASPCVFICYILYTAEGTGLGCNSKQNIRTVRPAPSWVFATMDN